MKREIWELSSWVEVEIKVFIFCQIKASCLLQKGKERGKQFQLHEAEGIDCNQPYVIALWRTFNISTRSLLYQESKENQHMRKRETAVSLDLNCKCPQAKAWGTFRQSVLVLTECMWPKLQEEPEIHCTCLETTVALSHYGRSPAQQVFNPILVMNYSLPFTPG